MMKRPLQSLFIVLFIATSIAIEHSVLECSVMAKECHEHPPELVIKTENLADRIFQD